MVLCIGNPVLNPYGRGGRLPFVSFLPLRKGKSARGIPKARPGFRKIFLQWERLFSILELKEYIPLGQRIRSFVVEVPDGDGEWRTIAEGTTVGYRRLQRMPPVRSRRLRVRILSSKASPVLCGVGLYFEGR